MVLHLYIDLWRELETWDVVVPESERVVPVQTVHYEGKSLLSDGLTNRSIQDGKGRNTYKDDNRGCFSVIDRYVGL